MFFSDNTCWDVLHHRLSSKDCVIPKPCLCYVFPVFLPGTFNLYMSSNSIFFPLGCLYYLKNLQQWLVPAVLSISLCICRSTHQELPGGACIWKFKSCPTQYHTLNKVPFLCEQKTCYCHWGVNLITCRSQYYELMKLLMIFSFC